MAWCDRRELDAANVWLKDLGNDEEMAEMSRTLVRILMLLRVPFLAAGLPAVSWKSAGNMT